MNKKGLKKQEKSLAIEKFETLDLNLMVKGTAKLATRNTYYSVLLLKVYVQ
jgi:hypothetical protein